MEPLLIRGFAAPFDVEAWLLAAQGGGMFESFAPGAFDFSNALRVDALLGSHDADPFASTAWKTLRFFQNRRGLGFEAEAPPTRDVCGWLQAMGSDGGLGVSVQFREDMLSGDWEASEDEDCHLHVRHVRCSIGHIAIAPNAVYGDHTVAWLADWECQPRLSARIRDAVAWWNQGQDPEIQTPQPMMHRRGNAPPAVQRQPQQVEKHVAGDISALLNAYQQIGQGVREPPAAAVAAYNASAAAFLRRRL